MKIVNRIFYVNVSSIKICDIPNYIETFKKIIQNDSSKLIKKLQENGLWEDLFVPTHDLPTKIELLHAEIDGC